MNKALVVLVVLLLAPASSKATCLHDGQNPAVVRVGSDCGGASCHYSDWQVATSQCVGIQQGDLLFELYAYPEDTPLLVGGNSSNYLITYRDVTVGSNAAWPGANDIAGRFRAILPTAGSGITITTSNVHLEHLLVFKPVNNNYSYFLVLGYNGGSQWADGAVVEDCFLWMENQGTGQWGWLIVRGGWGTQEIKNTVIRATRIPGYTWNYVGWLYRQNNNPGTIKFNYVTTYGDFMNGLIEGPFETMEVNYTTAAASGNCIVGASGEHNACSCSSCATTNPLTSVNLASWFEDAAGNNFHLHTDGSNALADVGSDGICGTSGYDTDIEEDARPANDACDIGADERP